MWAGRALVMTSVQILLISYASIIWSITISYKFINFYIQVNITSDNLVSVWITYTSSNENKPDIMTRLCKSSSEREVVRVFSDVTGTFNVWFKTCRLYVLWELISGLELFSFFFIECVYIYLCCSYLDSPRRKIKNTKSVVYAICDIIH